MSSIFGVTTVVNDVFKSFMNSNQKVNYPDWEWPTPQMWTLIKCVGSFSK